MKSNAKAVHQVWPPTSKFLLAMKFTAFFLIAALTQVSAKTYSQQVTLNEKNTSLKKLLSTIEKQTGYHFLYDKMDLAAAKAISIQMRNAPVSQAMEVAFKDQPLTYKIFTETIVIRKKDAPLNASIVADQTIQGKVVDEQGLGVPGASVKVKGTTTGATTDVNGSFSLRVADANSTLVVTSVGFTSQEVALGGRTTLTISLKTETRLLNAVVAIGYGAQRKSDLTGSVASVKSETLQERPATNVEQQLQGRVAGVNVSINSGRPGGSTNVIIRGANSINANNSPLYVVDGVIGAGPINYLNPNDIESIDVLKDASSTAIYGARGANGVIIVTTKRGSNNGGRVNYNSYVSFGTMARKLDVLNSKEFIQVEDNAYRNAQKYDPTGFAQGKYKNPQDYRRTLPNLFDSNGNPLYDTDWQKEATQTAVSNNQNISFTGGNKETSYGLFLNYANENGIVRESNLRRFSGRFVFDSQIKPWMKVGGSLTFNNVDDHQVDNGTGGLTITRMMVETLPIIPVMYPNGKYGSNADYPNMEGGENPVNLQRNRYDLYRTQTTLGNVYVNLNLTKDLEFRSTLGVNTNNQQGDFYSSRTLRQLSADVQGEARIDNTRQNYWQTENYFTYNKKINDNNRVNAVLGLSWQANDSFTNRAITQGFTDDFFQYFNLGAGSNPQAPSSYFYKWSMNSYFGRLNYTLNEKYLFTVTGRYDGSSKFGENKKYAFFPSAAFAWRVSEEGFLKNNKTISNLKFRTSYGLTGNSEITPYNSLAFLTNSTAIFGGTRASGTSISTLANPDLKWERTAQFDAGIELGLFNNRISFEGDVYYKKTTDMLLNAPVPISSGFSSIYKNIGSLSNKGVELALNTVNIKTSNFNWSTTFNISINKNKILALGEANDDIFPSPYFLSNTNIIRVGESAGAFYGRVREGIWGTNEAAEAAKYGKLPGDVKHKDINGDGQINDADRVIIGKGLPTGFGTFSNTFRYKQLDLTVDLQYMYGNDILNLSRHSGEDRTGQANSYATVLNGWTPQNQNTMIAENRPASAGYTSTVDSHMIEDGSFIRGRNLLLGYTFTNNITKKLKLSNLRVYASVQNWFLTTKYSGYDPEVTTYTVNGSSNASTASTGNNFAQGITFFDYPKPRTFLFGINASF
ncbi:TonB-dependent receptor [Mucilaginibacter sp. Bleaf8]|uniref:TonB-dependent receptor n=1 Tax=Mucilaginibacter sp. Bleaf8 TaxID=2834430 RepID=UPI001BD10E14|nr:TonB-dependent receptor [Mucilaginibacter sp. Bleaf8]MBS7563892.1 TonB-dependent receptor [Mucilaginibacter sp. Bleaf8]